MYSKVIGNIAPLQQELDQTETSLEVSKISINNTKKELDDLASEVKNLNTV